MSDETRFPSVVDLGKLLVFPALPEAEQDELLPVLRLLNNTVARALRERNTPKPSETA